MPLFNIEDEYLFCQADDSKEDLNKKFTFDCAERKHKFKLQILVNPIVPLKLELKSLFNGFWLIHPKIPDLSHLENVVTSIFVHHLVNLILKNHVLFWIDLYFSRDSLALLLYHEGFLLFGLMFLFLFFDDSLLYET